jgi:aldose sugar dehydrogenase
MDSQQQPEPQPEPAPEKAPIRSRKRLILILALVLTALLVLAAVVAAYSMGLIKKGQSDIRTPSPATIPQIVEETQDKAPTLKEETVINGLTNAWDIGFASDGTMFFTERPGQINTFVDGQKRQLAKPADVAVAFEAGMMGLAVDPEFTANRYLYTCFATTLRGRDEIHLVRWKVSADLAGLSDRQDIISDIPMKTGAQRGRHAGCRPRFGPDGYLWVGTGDAATGTLPQDPNSLGGKILRVDRDGKAAPDNIGGAFDGRIYSYGHRNTQGLAFNIAAGQPVGYSVEHGPGIDDEVNPLAPGNFGWNPVPGYNEAVPMTDTAKYVDAVAAIWRSGDPTIAPSGATILTGKQWGSWQGSLAMAVLKGSHLRILHLKDGKVVGEEKFVTSRGRLRSAVQGTDGNLYLTTDNGAAKDEIIRIIPELK